MRGPLLAAAAVVLVALGAGGLTTAVIADQRNLSIGDLLAGKTHKSVAQPPTFVIDCTEAHERPDEITLACGDGNALLDHLTWSTWGRPTATGQGNYTANDCNPYCAVGHFQSVPVTVTLSGLRHGSAGDVYTSALVHYVPVGPGGHDEDTFDLPSEPGP